MLGFLTTLLVVAQFALPRRWAFAPLVMAVCLLPNLPVLNVGLTFTPSKLLVLAGLLRALCGRNGAPLRLVSLDIIVVAWALWAIASAMGHAPKDHNPLTVRLALAYDVGGSYLYVRLFIKTREDCERFMTCLAGVMVVVGASMTWEKMTGQNVLSTFVAGVETEATVRGGRVRASGAFMSPILAGTFGATAAVLMPILLRAGERTRLAKAGLAASIATVICSASSGPVIALAAGMAALYLWYWRTSVRRIFVAFLLSLVALHIVMKAPVWYLLARMNLIGGSTGFHRAELITQALKHFSDWWLIGTDYTRDWFAYGVEWSAYTADITNYYIKMGVIGGLPLLLLYLAIWTSAFRTIGRLLKAARRDLDPFEFAIWCVGASLFAHCVAFVSISYFDQNDMVPSWLFGMLPALGIRSDGTKTRTGTRRQNVRETHGRVRRHGRTMVRAAGHTF